MVFIAFFSLLTVGASRFLRSSSHSGLSSTLRELGVLHDVTDYHDNGLSCDADKNINSEYQREIKFGGGHSSPVEAALFDITTGWGQALTFDDCVKYAACQCNQYVSGLDSPEPIRYWDAHVEHFNDSSKSGWNKCKMTQCRFWTTESTYEPIPREAHTTTEYNNWGISRHTNSNEWIKGKSQPWEACPTNKLAVDASSDRCSCGEKTCSRNEICAKKNGVLRCECGSVIDASTLGCWCAGRRKGKKPKRKNRNCNSDHGGCKGGYCTPRDEIIS